MADFVSSGRIADLILLVLLLEGVALYAYWRIKQSGVPPVDILLFMGSGAALVLALRVALTDGWWGWIGLALTASFFVHAADLLRRWRS